MQPKAPQFKKQPQPGRPKTGKAVTAKQAGLLANLMKQKKA